MPRRRDGDLTADELKAALEATHNAEMEKPVTAHPPPAGEDRRGAEHTTREGNDDAVH